MVHTQRKLSFVSIEQFRSLGNESRGEPGGVLNIPLLAATIMEEVRKPRANLKVFLINNVLSNHGVIHPLEIRDLAIHLFVNEQNAELLNTLDRDQCLGYSQEEITNIRLTLASPDAANYSSTAIREALGLRVMRRL